MSRTQIWGGVSVVRASPSLAARADPARDSAGGAAGEGTDGGGPRRAECDGWESRTFRFIDREFVAPCALYGVHSRNDTLPFSTCAVLWTCTLQKVRYMSICFSVILLVSSFLIKRRRAGQRVRNSQPWNACQTRCQGGLILFGFMFNPGPTLEAKPPKPSMRCCVQRKVAVHVLLG